MTLSRFQSIMSPLVQFFKPAPTEDAIKDYYDLLSHIPEWELERAVVEVCKTR